jgi:hypothetical protein
MTTSGGNWLQALGRLMRGGPPQSGWVWNDRYAAYSLWDAYYSNRVYETFTQGGQRESINDSLGNASAADLAGLYNPVSQVVDLYLNVFAGAFGDEITVEPTGAATPALVEAVNQVWQWSNLTIEKQPLCRLAATHGSVGLRIVARDHEDAGRRRVYIKPEHPKTIRDVQLDDRGNVEAIQLEYDLAVGLAEDSKVITIREQLEPDRIQTWRTQGETLIRFDLMGFAAAGMPPGDIGAFDRRPNADYVNALGVVPYVLLRHEHTGETWGHNAFYKARSPIDRLNALMCHTDIEIHRHVRATWLLAAAGAAPERFTFDDLSIVYVDTRNATSNPMAQALVANLDLAGAANQAKLQIDLIEDMLPELKATAGKFLSGQSGETIAELRKPAEDKIGLARANYEDALTRAQQIATSWGIMLGLWDIGTGSGTREAAERAYREGFEDHRFNRRPLLTSEAPSTTPAQAQQPRAEAPPSDSTSMAQNGAQAPMMPMNGNGKVVA